MNKRYTLKIYPKGMGRDAYRVIEISDNRKLSTLAEEILDAFDFDFDHLYEFIMSGEMYRSHDVYVAPGIDGERSANIKLDKLGLEKGRKFLYHYDFGDDWLFIVSVQKVTEEDGPHETEVIKSKGDVYQYGFEEEEDDEYWD